MTKEELFNLTSVEMLVELSHNEIIFVSLAEKVIFMNSLALSFRGLNPEVNHEDLTLEDLYSKGTANVLRDILEKLRHKSTIFTDLCALNHLTNEYVYLDSRVTAFRNDKQELKGFVITSYDVTSEVGARQELTRSQNYLHSIIETASDGIIIMNSKGIIQSVNPAAARLFGYEPEEMGGESIKMMMPKEYSDQHDDFLLNHSNSDIARIVGVGREVGGKRKDGKIFPFRLSMSRIIVGQGQEKEYYYTGIVHDLTEQKNAEARLRTLNKELEERVSDRTEELADTVNKLLKEVSERKNAEALLKANQVEIQNALKKERELSDLKSRFISMASHEFRTPLSAIALSATLISRYEGASSDMIEKRLKHVERIQSNVKTVTDILKDFLSLSRLEEGKFENNPEECDIKLFSEKILDDLQGFKKQNQKIQYIHLSERKEVKLDLHLLKNVLINLISNAVKYSKDDGNIYFQTEISSDKLHIRIKDSGIGIPQDEQKFLFDRFFRAKNASNIQGTGLGLNIVKQYVEIMRGTIHFISNEGEGTTFDVQIPTSIPQNSK